MVSNAKRTGRLQAVFAVAILGIASVTSASTIPDPDVQPANYQSPSGEFRWFVDPSARSGEGPAIYRVTRGGKVIFAGELPVTVRLAVVGDDGRLFGHHCPNDQGRMSDPIRFVAVGVDGTVREIERFDDSEDRFSYGPLLPTCEQAVLTPDGQTVVARHGIYPEDREQSELYVDRWSAYSTRDFAPVFEATPFRGLLPESSDDIAADVVPVRGTSIYAAAFRNWPSRDGGRPVSIRLLDQSLSQVAAIEVTLADSPEVRGFGHRSGFELASPEEGLLELAEFGKDLARLKVKPNELGGWAITAQSADNASPKDKGFAQSGSLVDEAVSDLRPQREFLLAAGRGLEAGLGTIIDFGFDGGGRLGVLSACEGGRMQFRRVRQDGFVEAEWPIAIDHCEDFRAARLVWLAPKRWLLSMRSEEAVLVEWIDDESGVRTPLPEEARQPFEKIVATMDGGFVANVDSLESISGREGLVAVGAAGQVRWLNQPQAPPGIQTCTDDGAAPSRVAAAAELRVGELALNTAGELLALDLFEPKIHRLDVRGVPIATVELKDPSGRAATYNTKFVPLPDGGFLVDWSGHVATYARFSAEGKQLLTIEPTRPDGAAFDPYYLRVDPAGRVWMANHDVIFRVGPLGAADLVIGRTIDASSLDRVTGAAADRDGAIHVVDGRSGTLFRFHLQGTLLGSCEIPPSLRSSLELGIDLATDDRNRALVMVRPQWFWISTDCEITPSLRFPEHTLPEQASPVGDGKQLWATYDAELRLIDGEGRHHRMIKRAVNGSWLSTIGGLSVAPDRSLALISSAQTYLDADHYVLSLYDANGEAAADFALAAGSVSKPSYDGQFVAYLQFEGDRHSIRVLRIGDGRDVRVAQVGEDLISIALTGDGSGRALLAMHEDGRVQFWSIDEVFRQR
jgi:hypothetical protein